MFVYFSFSYILTGTERGMKETFGTTCHGAVSIFKNELGRIELNSLKKEDIVVSPVSNINFPKNKILQNLFFKNLVKKVFETFADIFQGRAMSRSKSRFVNYYYFVMKRFCFYKFD